ncbi:hypothetical protein KEM09_12000 [Carboxylicivirga mesophila]|uniref:DUF1574 domain-containing protein n=1 Tax=Carboxylicivirga mesophila TaxID=1166478 RepID=A0ABS5KB59_9BACT|nr:hypothetical protein [Carboxylicivirga mesophila]MBS2212132.1 hypothetical protein [Carboxylicivirga mesophila]
MQKLIKNLTIFLLPLLIILGLVELKSRLNNTFYAKKEYIDYNKDSLEVLILGSSQTWRAINPKFIKSKCAPLAHGGSALNIDYLLLRKYIKELPLLKVVLIETSYHTLENYCDSSWNKNHLFYIYYDINNYNSEPPMKDNLLITANFSQYFKKFWTNNIFPEFGKYNKYGFITSAIDNLDVGKYDSLFLAKRHCEENIVLFKKNARILDEMINICLQHDISVILFSPPKHFNYNKNNVLNKLKRRNATLKKYENVVGIHILNLENKYEDNIDIFYNEDHLNVYGAEKVSRIVDSLTNKIINENIINNN